MSRFDIAELGENSLWVYCLICRDFLGFFDLQTPENFLIEKALSKPNSCHLTID